MIKYFSIFILYVVAITIYFYVELQMKHDVVKQNYLNQIELSYSNGIKTYEVLNDRFYGTYTDMIAKELSLANGADTKIRDKARANLLKELSKFFGELKLIGFNGMQIIDKDGKSLLRLHKPYAYDDSIIEKRLSLQRLKKDILYQKGYESGEFVMSYRFQYPLFYDGQFVGVCEFSLKPNTILENLKNNKEYRVLTLYEKHYMQKVLQKSVLSKKYKRIMLFNRTFYYDKTDKILPFDAMDWQESMKKSVFTYYYNSQWHIVAVLPMYDIVGNHIGHIFVDKIDCSYADLFYDILKNYLLFFMTGVIVLFFYLKQRKILEYSRELINLQNDILVVTDGKYILDVNKKMLAFFGYENLDSFSKEHECICDFFIQERGYLYKTMGTKSWIEYIEKERKSQILVKMYNKTTEVEEIFEIDYLPFKDHKRFFLIFKDITEKFYKEKELLDMAYIDTLTKIHNRRSLDRVLESKYEQSKRVSSLLSLIMLDIDHFKNINDTYGHDVGDVILQELSQLILSKIRKYDTFARWGGEEFMILADLDLESTQKLAEKLRYEVEHFEFSVDEKITISLGVVEYKRGESIEQMTKRVDNLLYKAKESGRNRVEF